MSGTVSLFDGHIDRPTDNEIKKALECCEKLNHNAWSENMKICKEECPYKANCYDEEKNINMITDALDLINRQQAEIEALYKIDAKSDEEISELRKELLKRQNLEESFSKITKQFDKKLARTVELTKSEAIKEFAERLKEKARPTAEFCEVVLGADIDNLVKEMVGK